MTKTASLDDLRSRIAQIEGREGDARGCDGHACDCGGGIHVIHEDADAPGSDDAKASRGDRGGCIHVASAAGNEAAATKAGEEEEAFQKIVRLVSCAEHSAAGLRRKLRQVGFEEDACDAAIDRALRCGLVDDKRFADILVRSRLSQGKGVRGIRRELEDEGIDPLGVEAFCEVEDGREEFARAQEALRRRPPRSKNRREGAYRMLVRKGYEPSVAASAARAWAEDAGAAFMPPHPEQDG